MAAERRFLVDETEGIRFAAGFSGHGYKFAPLIAPALAEWVASGNRGVLDSFRLTEAQTHTDVVNQPELSVM